MSSKSGFTLLELLLVVVLVAAITAFSVPIFSSLVTTSELNDATDKIVHSLRRAQLLSETSKEDLSWGVYVATGEVVVFGGGNYASRDAQFDEIYDFSDQVSVSGINEFIFTKLTGEVVVPGTITVTNNFGSESVGVSAQGVLSF